jgi:hypothetical protein
MLTRDEPARPSIAGKPDPGTLVITIKHLFRPVRKQKRGKWIYLCSSVCRGIRT